MNHQSGATGSQLADYMQSSNALMVRYGSCGDNDDFDDNDGDDDDHDCDCDDDGDDGDDWWILL